MSGGGDGDEAAASAAAAAAASASRDAVSSARLRASCAASAAAASRVPPRALGRSLRARAASHSAAARAADALRGGVLERASTRLQLANFSLGRHRLLGARASLRLRRSRPAPKTRVAARSSIAARVHQRANAFGAVLQFSLELGGAAFGGIRASIRFVGAARRRRRLVAAAAASATARRARRRSPPRAARGLRSRSGDVPRRRWPGRAGSPSELDPTRNAPTARTRTTPLEPVRRRRSGGPAADPLACSNRTRR